MPLDPSILRGVWIGDFIDKAPLPKVPLWASDYTRSILESRRAFQNGLAPRILEQLNRAFAEMLVRIYEDAGTGILTADRAEALADSIRRHMARLEAQMAKIAGDGALGAARLAANGHKNGLDLAARAAGVKLTTSFTEVPGRALELMGVRRLLPPSKAAHDFANLLDGTDLGVARAMRTLIHRHVTGSVADMDDLIRQFVITGRSWTDASRDIAGILARGDTELMQAMVKHLGARGGKLRNEISQDFWRDLDELAAQDENYAEIIQRTKIRAQTLLFDSRRIGITEINTAHWEADRLAAVTSPVVKAVKMALSGRHAAIGIPCECDVLTQVDLYDLGQGVYYPETCPSRPHPFCACLMLFILRKVEEWQKPKVIPPKPREISDSTIEDFLNQAHDHARINKPATVTAKRIARVKGNVNGLNKRAYEVWSGKPAKVQDVLPEPTPKVPSFRNPASPQDVVREAKTLEEAQQIALDLELASQVKYGKLANVDIANAINRALLQNKKATGETFDAVKVVRRTSGSWPRVPAQAATTYINDIRQDVELVVNNFYFEQILKAGKDVNRQIRKSKDSGWWIAGSVEDLVHHEFGHLLTFSGRYRYYQRLERLGKLDHLAVSRYGKTQGVEALAEIWALYQSEGRAALKQEWIDYWNKWSQRVKI